MTRLLQEAFTRAEELSPERQDSLAQWLLEEMKSEQIWDRLFAESQDALSALAKEALDEYETGETQELVPGDL